MHANEVTDLMSGRGGDRAWPPRSEAVRGGEWLSEPGL
jgi:hypothetical protein